MARITNVGLIAQNEGELTILAQTANSDLIREGGGVCKRSFIGNPACDQLRFAILRHNFAIEIGRDRGHIFTIFGFAEDLRRIPCVEILPESARHIGHCGLRISKIQFHHQVRVRQCTNCNQDRHSALFRIGSLQRFCHCRNDLNRCRTRCSRGNCTVQAIPCARTIRSLRAQFKGDITHFILHLGIIRVIRLIAPSIDRSGFSQLQGLFQIHTPHICSLGRRQQRHIKGFNIVVIDGVTRTIHHTHKDRLGHSRTFANIQNIGIMHRHRKIIGVHLFHVVSIQRLGFGFIAINLFTARFKGTQYAALNCNIVDTRQHARNITISVRKEGIFSHIQRTIRVGQQGARRKRCRQRTITRGRVIGHCRRNVVPHTRIVVICATTQLNHALIATRSLPGCCGCLNRNCKGCPCMRFGTRCIIRQLNRQGAKRGLGRCRTHQQVANDVGVHIGRPARKILCITHQTETCISAFRQHITKRNREGLKTCYKR